MPLYILLWTNDYVLLRVTIKPLLHSALFLLLISLAGPSYAQQRRDEIAQKSGEAQANKAVKDMECTAWQAEVDRLEPNRRVFYTNDEGETVRMDDVERTNGVANLKSQIAKNCK